MDLLLDIRIDDFNGAMAEMQRRLANAAPKRTVINYEVGRILAKTLEKTTAATAASINRSVKTKEWTTVGGKGGKKYLLTNRYPDKTWRMIQEHLAASLARKLAAVSWARKTWYAIGILIGQPVEDKGSAKATVPQRSVYQNVSTKQESGDGDYKLTIRNDYPLMRWANGRQAFFSAVAGRIGFFRRNLAHGVFNDLKKVQAKYPGLRIDTPPV